MPLQSRPNAKIRELAVRPIAHEAACNAGLEAEVPPGGSRCRETAPPYHHARGFLWIQIDSLPGIGLGKGLSRRSGGRGGQRSHRAVPGPACHSNWRATVEMEESFSFLTDDIIRVGYAEKEGKLTKVSMVLRMRWWATARMSASVRIPTGHRDCRRVRRIQSSDDGHPHAGQAICLQRKSD